MSHASTQTSETAPAAPRPATSRRRRIVEAVGFVAVWVGAGYLLPLDANGYLLLGIPLTVAFQVLVRRRPLRELFAAGTTRFALGRRGATLAIALAVVPGCSAVRALPTGDAAQVGWYLAAVAGAVAAAFSLRAGSVGAVLRSVDGSTGPLSLRRSGRSGYPGPGVATWHGQTMGQHHRRRRSPPSCRRAPR